MAKVLIFSDFHLHNWTYGATYENGWNSRLVDQKHVADQLVEVANRHRVDYVVFCGDLFHTHGKVESGPLAVASDLFSRLRAGNRGVFALVGNHDLGRESTSIDWLANLGVTVVKDIYAETIGDEPKMGFVAYCHNEQQFKNRIAELKKHDLQYWFLHQGVESVPVGSDFVIPNEFFSPEDLPTNSRFSMAFTGHYHSHRWARDRIVVVGSPMQFTWSDKGDLRGCIVLDTWNNMWQFEVLKSPRFTTLDGALNPNFPIYGLIGREHLVREGNQIQDCFVKVTEEIPPIFIEDVRQKLYAAGARSVEFSYKQTPAKIGMATNVFDMEHLIERYTLNNKVPELARTIREQIRQGIYETP